LNDFGIDREYLDSNFEPAAVYGVIWQDTIWALPESQESIALVYNIDTLPSRYLPRDPFDFEDLYQKAEQYQEDTGKVLVCNQGFGASDAYHVAPIYFGFGVPSYIDDEGNVYIDSPDMIKAGEWLRKFASVSFQENSYEICQAALVEGEAAMWWTGPWAIAGLEREGVNYGIVPMGRPFVGIKTLMLTTNAVQRGHYETALDVMKYFTSAEAQITLALNNKTIPANSAALRDSRVAALQTLQGFGEAAAIGIPMANTPFAGAQWGPVGDASAAIWSGAQSPQDALREAQKAAEEAVDSIR
jgi:arabinogalactan oligomer/maltooligosaccharide transport system substrate-binding protein